MGSLQDQYKTLANRYEERLSWLPAEIPFVNETYGTQMNQDAGFTGTPVLIHNGLDTVAWTGTDVSGGWNFANAGKVTIDNAQDGNRADFDTGSPVDMSNYVGISGKITLRDYNSLNNGTLIQFRNGVTFVGNQININNFIDTGLIGVEQSFSIPTTTLGLSGETVDGFSVIMQRTGPPLPDISLDDIQIEETGGVIEFDLRPPTGFDLFVHELRLVISGPVSSILLNSTMPTFDYNTFAGLPALANGCVFEIFVGGVLRGTRVLRSINDFLQQGTEVIGAPTTNSTGTISTIHLTQKFVTPATIPNEEGTYTSFLIEDNLSTLTRFNISAKGAIAPI